VSRFRPAFHLSPPTGWLNDPNGLVYYRGEYHLFYQWCDALQIDVTKMHWAHAVSTDLVRWKHLPHAIAPGDECAIWSGSAVVDSSNTSGFFNGGEGLVAAYTEFKKLANPERTTEKQGIAFSRDNGRTWTKYDDNPVLTCGNHKDFRDPKVFWHAPTQRWIMIIGVEQQLYASTNLREWQYLSHTGLKSECPDMFSLPIENEASRKWVISLGGVEYSVGEFNGSRFTHDGPPIQVDHGGDFYASQSWENAPDGRRIWLAWMSQWKYAGKVPDFGARGLMTVPRELSLRRMPGGALRLVQRPVPELSSLRKECLIERARIGGSSERLFASDTFEIRASLRPAGGGSCGFRVLASKDCETVIGFDDVRVVGFVDRERCGSDVTTGVFTAPVRKIDGRVDVQIFVDRCSVEVFFNGGETVFSNLVFPREGARDATWFSSNGSSAAERCMAHSMEDVASYSC